MHPNLHDPAFIATDQSGTIFAASTDGVITRFPSDITSASGWKRTAFATRFGGNMDAFAADAAGHFYLSSASNNAIVTIGASGAQGVLSGDKTELKRPLGLAVNRDGALYVANTGSNDVLVFARGSTGNVPPIARLSGPATRLVAPQALAIDASGKLYVFDGPQTALGFGAAHHVRVYDANAYGNAAPIQTYDVQTKCWTNAV
jgi:sugar lactone lactonase YvrE